VQGLKALSMGGAFTGVGSDASTVFFNPGALTNLDGHNFTVGINLISPHVSLQTPETANIDQTTGLQTPFFFYYSGTIFKEKLKNKLKVGFLVNNQFGSSASFKDNWQGRNIIQNISLKTFMFQPTVSYKIFDKLSIGAGFVFSTGSFTTEKAIPVGSSTTTEGKARLEGNGTAMGYNVGVYLPRFLTIGNKDGDIVVFNLGVDYRSKLKIDLAGGSATFTNIPSSLLLKFPASTTFNSQLTLPDVLTTGLSAKVIKDNWSLEFAYDLQWTGWSTYDSLNFDFANADTPDSKTYQNWGNTLTHRFGVDFTYKNKYSVRAGVYYDNTPMKDGFVSPHLPGISQFVYTAGLGYKISDLISVDFAILREDAQRETGFDAAGFTAKYHRIVNIYSFGVNIKFGATKSETATPTTPPAAE